MNVLQKSSITKIGASTSFFSNALKLAYHIGVQLNLHSFLVKAKRGSAIFA